MPNYYIDTDSELETDGEIGVEEGSQTLNVYITNKNPQNGNWNGKLIQAKNFKIQGGNLTESDGGLYTWASQSTTMDASEQVASVMFSNDGNIGDAANRVQMTINLSAFTPTGDTSISINLEESDDYPIESDLEYGVHEAWQFGGALRNSGHTVLYSASDDDFSLQTQAVTAGTPDADNVYYTYQETISTLEPNKIFDVKFPAHSFWDDVEANPDSHDHFIENSISVNLDYTGGGPLNVPTNNPWYEMVMNYISYNIIKTYNANGLVTSFRVEASLDLGHPNENAVILIAYESSFGEEVNDPVVWGITINAETADSTVVGPDAEVVDTIFNVTYPSYLSAHKQEGFINVFGTPSAPYSISVEKKTSTTSTVTAGTGGYYNFSTAAFQDTPVVNNTACNHLGVKTNIVNLPYTIATTRYDITLSGLVNGEATLLKPGVPEFAGDAVMTKVGRHVVTVKPVTYVDTNFGTMPSSVISIKEAQADTSSGKGIATAPKSLTTTGGTGGSSSTRLVLDTSSRSIFAGMVVTGSGVAHESTVVSANKNIVTLNQVSTIANNTELSFTENTEALQAFSFTVVPNAGGDALTVNTTVDLVGAFGGLGAKKASINVAAANTVLHTLDSTKGIVAGMTVTGDQVYMPAGFSLGVKTVTNGTDIILSHPQSFRHNAGLKFSGGNSGADFKVHSVQANKVGDNIVITGYLLVKELLATSTVDIYIDDIIDVT